MKTTRTALHTLACKASALLLTGTAFAQHQLTQLYAQGGDENDAFGSSVAISEGLFVVGAEDIEIAGKLRAGSAFLFETSQGDQLFQLAVSDPAVGAHLGCSVGISGDRVIAGAWAYSSGFEQRAGTAYIFDTDTGQELFKLLPSVITAYDFYGYGVAISGDRAIVGAYGDDEVADNAGAAYIIDVNTGQELFKLTPSDGGANFHMGKAVAIHGNLAIAGAPGADSDSGTQATGAAYVFDVTTGQQLFKLGGSDGSTGDKFGEAVAISGDRALVGAEQGSGVSSRTGTAYIFDLTTGLETHMLQASDGETFDMFGYSVAIGPEKAVVGAREDSEQGQDSGTAYVFDVATGQELPKILPTNGHFGDRFTESVALNNGRLVVGVPVKYDPQHFRRGSAYLFCTESVGTSFCTANPHAFGRTVHTIACGSPSLAKGDLTLFADGIMHTTYLFFYGTTQIQVPFGDGYRCVGGRVRRLGPAQLTVSGVATRALDMGGMGLVPGSLNFQCWYRDTTAGGAGFNLSDGLNIDFVP